MTALGNEFTPLVASEFKLCVSVVGYNTGNLCILVKIDRMTGLKDRMYCKE